MQNEGPGTEEHRLIDLMARLMAAWGLPPASGRVYGYLLLSATPVSLDQLATDLAMSKSGASVAGKQLETWGLVHRMPERGSKRLLFEATTDIDILVATNSRATQAFVDVFRQGAATARAPVAKERMEEMAEFFEMVMVETEEMLRRWRERRKS